jgi:hypothetical protein
VAARSSPNRNGNEKKKIENERIIDASRRLYPKRRIKAEEGPPKGGHYDSFSMTDATTRFATRRSSWSSHT